MKNFSEEKLCLITGGSKGIGFSIAIEMAKKGYTIILNSRNPHNATQYLKENNFKVIELPGDIKEDSFIKNLTEIIDNYGYVDSILLNYGGPPIKPFINISEQEWIEYFNTMFLAPLRIIKEMIKYLEKSKYPRILAITSFTTIKPMKNMCISNSLRMGLVNALKTIALETAEKNILINTLAPGYIYTERLQEFIKKQSEIIGINHEEFKNSIEKTIPLNRIAQASELAKFASFLLSEDNTYITGQHFTFDGGLTT
ncbi:MAG: SDR family oxidoreductase [bacterium]|nr:SDR family oxidoreductase [bacterium]